MKIGFFHTSPVHVPTFDDLFAQTSLKVELCHQVDEQLLADAIQNGVDEKIKDQVVNYARGLAADGCETIVCTCSTIGAVAEQVDIPNVEIYRVDRPMAARTVAESDLILMVAVLDSTLVPTRQLLIDEAHRQNKTVQVQELVIPEAWGHFLSGDHEAYQQHIAAAIETKVTKMGYGTANFVPDVILLAQASMAGAAKHLTQLGRPVLSSPAVCVEFLQNQIANERR